MDGRKQLTTLQAKKIHDAVFPTLGFLTQLEERLRHLGFPPNDRFYSLVAHARAAVHGLSVEAHYQSLPGGVGRESKNA